jgi:hypothetical protein
MEINATAAASKAYVGLFKDNSIAVLDLVNDRVLSSMCSAPSRSRLDRMVW